VMVITQAGLLKPLVNRVGERKLVLVGTLLQLVSAIGLFTVSSWWAVMLFIVIFGLGYGITSPVLQSLITQVGTEQTAGRMLGWFQSVSSLSLILGPAWGGYVFDAISPQAIFAVSAGLMVLAIALSLGLQREGQAFQTVEPENAAAQINTDVYPQTGEA
jgi:MFS transporter, DHA1 family, tetracycline resistance protein